MGAGRGVALLLAQPGEAADAAGAGGGAAATGERSGKLPLGGEIAQGEFLARRSGAGLRSTSRQPFTLAWKRPRRRASYHAMCGDKLDGSDAQIVGEPVRDPITAAT